MIFRGFKRKTNQFFLNKKLPSFLKDCNEKRSEKVQKVLVLLDDTSIKLDILSDLKGLLELTENDIEKCVGTFHGINIKVMKCGGLTPALKMIQKARALDLKVMVGCMTESTVGISAIAHLLPLLDYADMDGPLFLKEDIASGIKITNEGIQFPKEKGTGVNLLS